ncbi:metallophosphoesterase [Sanguibacter sp. A247]|uniref:metallophosphoesterase n=1 Tax=unclassified Sanguibacter TaxID=2645534 RepID=UPI003FD86072
MTRLRRSLGLLTAAGALALAWARIEAEAFTVRRVTVPVLPSGATPVRVLHVSDLHLTPAQQRKIAWVRSLAELTPDLVINTGDNFAHLDGLAALQEALGPLTAFPGAFVMGSNDVFSPLRKSPARYLLPSARRPQTSVQREPDLPTAALASFFTDAGWHDLGNARARLRLGELDIAFAGLDDPHIDRDRLPAPEAALTDGVDLRLGVVHAPYLRALDALRADGADAIIAGHTHGGQLCVPGFGALVTNCDLDRGRASGLHGWPGPRPDEFGGHESVWLHVSNGAGTNPYTPLRFACRPSATLLTLVPR